MSGGMQTAPRILIVDDEAPARARLTTLLADIAGQCPHSLVGEAAQAQQALDKIAELRPDIVLLDVQMPGMSGIEFAMHLAQSEYASTAIIFVTAHDAYALKAFEVHALDYLLKPVRAGRLAEAIARAGGLRRSSASQQSRPTAPDSTMQQNLQQRQMAELAAALPQARRNFSVQERGRLLLVPVAEVLYLKAEAKYVTLRTREREYLIEASLLSLEQELGERFVRVHRNALVARDAILGVEKGTLSVSESEADGERVQETWQVILRDVDDRLPISRRQWPGVKALVK
jgi:two-component system response regulator AlgR